MPIPPHTPSTLNITSMSSKQPTQSSSMVKDDTSPKIARRSSPRKKKACQITSGERGSGHGGYKSAKKSEVKGSSSRKTEAKRISLRKREAKKSNVRRNSKKTDAKKSNLRKSGTRRSQSKKSEDVKSSSTKNGLMVKINFKKSDVRKKISPKNKAQITKNPNTTISNVLSSLRIRLPSATPIVSSRVLYNAKKPFQCEVCRKRFRMKGYLKKHERAPEFSKHFPCMVCGKIFPERDKLRDHERIHTGERPFSCELCSLTFVRKDQLRIHTRCHTGEKPFSCGLCQKSFTRHDKLLVHHRTHSGERPYECEVCMKTFARGDHLKKHMDVHAPGNKGRHGPRKKYKKRQSRSCSDSPCDKDDFKNENEPGVAEREKPKKTSFLTPAYDLLKAISASTAGLTLPDKDKLSAKSSLSSQQVVPTCTKSVTPLQQSQWPPLSSTSLSTLVICKQENSPSQEQPQHTSTFMLSSDDNLKIPLE